MTKRRRQLEGKRKRRLKRLLIAQEAMAKSVGSNLANTYPRCNVRILELCI